VTRGQEGDFVKRKEMIGKEREASWLGVLVEK
jgi:hypothetical protein